MDSRTESESEMHMVHWLPLELGYCQCVMVLYIIIYNNLEHNPEVWVESGVMSGTMRADRTADFELRERLCEDLAPCPA